MTERVGIEAAQAVADQLVGCEQRPRLEIPKAPFQHLLGFLGAVIRVVEAVDDHDQPRVVLHGRADQADAILRGLRVPKV